MYLKSIVYKPDQVFLAENIYSGDYIRGMDTSMHDLRSVLSENTEANQRSIFTCLVPLPTFDKSDSLSYMTEPPNPLDCTGRFSGNVPHLTSIDNDNDTRGRLHYASADFYSRLYQWCVNAAQAGIFCARLTLAFYRNNSEVGNSSADGYAYESVNRCVCLLLSLHFGH